jgi:hypothetical protein
MKKQFWKDFLFRGLLAAAGGPVIIAIIYGILGATGTVTSLSPTEVCTGILSITLMAFIAAGITAVYQMEQLPLPGAIAIHAVVLYLDYLIMYLLNRWIPRDLTALGIFTAIFFGSFALVWLIIYQFVKRDTEQVNRKMRA